LIQKQGDTDVNDVLQASNICKNYYSNSVKVEALKPTNLNISVGSINVFFGRSGSGKSTLLKVLGGLLKPDDGQVLIEEQSIYLLSETCRTHLRSLKAGFVFQEFNLINELSVINNIRLPFDINDLPYDLRSEDEIISMLDLEKRLHFYPDQLSGGERQRTAIARALLMKPSLIFADEPTGNLDVDSGKSVMDFVETSNRQRNQTYIIVTHDVEWLKIAHHVFKMSDGNLSAEK
jgi:putative ABC transport system ATP-binding protein